jgi:hypothetical protein
VTDEALEELARIPSLAHLTLKGSLATNAGLQHLRALPRLTHLDLGSRWELDDTGVVWPHVCCCLLALLGWTCSAAMCRQSCSLHLQGLPDFEMLSIRLASY